MKNKTHLFILLIALFLANSLFATNYYIDATGGNDSNNGLSTSSAWKTLSKLNNSWSLIKPGDSILFKSGEAWRPSGVTNALIAPPNSGLHGTEQARITFGAYGDGAKPIISRINSSSAKAFYARNISYVTIQDIEFRGDVWFYGSITMASEIHHLKLLRLTIDGAASGDATGGYLEFYAPAVEGAAEQWNQSEMNNIELGYSLIKNTSGSGIQMYGQGNNWIHNNEFYNLGGSGINFAEGDNNIIEYNIVSGAKSTGLKHSVHSHTSNNIIIRGNLIIRSNGGISAYNLINAKIYNNTIRVFGTESAIFGWTTQTPVPISSVGKTGFDNNYIQNNIFYGGQIYLWKADNVKITYKDGTTINYSQEDLWVDNFFKSNIYYNPSSSNQMYFRDFVAGTTVYYNASAAGTYSNTIATSDLYVNTSNFSSYWNSRSNVTNDMNADPLFVNDYWTSAENFGDYSLKSASPGAGTGYAFSDYSVDLAGNSVPTSGLIDVGAFQTNSTSNSDTTPPSLTSVEITDQTTLVLSFSENLGSSNVTSSSNYSISGGITVNSAQLSSSQNQITLKTSSHSFDVSYSVSVNNLSDLAGNSINPNSNSLSYSLSAPADVIPPVLLNAELSTLSSLELTFSENISQTNAENVNNYQIYDGSTQVNLNPNLFVEGRGSFENGTESWIPYSSNTIASSADYSADGSKSLKMNYVNSGGGAYLYLNRSKDLVSDLVVGKTYTVSYYAVVNSGTNTMFTVSGGDLNAIDVPITTTLTKYEITFTASSPTTHYLRLAKLAAGQWAYVDKIEIREASSSKSFLNINSASLSSDQTKVTLVTGDHLPNINYTVSTSNISDLAGNVISSDSNSKNYSLVGEIDTTPPTLTNAEITDQTTLVLSFSENLGSSNVTSSSNYSISGGITVNSAQLSSSQNQITLKTSSHSFDVSYSVSVNNLSDLAGNTINPNSNSLSYSLSAPADVIPPVLTDAQLSNSTTLLLSFSEKISQQQAVNAANYQISDGSSNTNVNLFDLGKGSFENGTESWVPYSSNTISASSDFSSDGSYSLKMDYVNSGGGAYLYLADATDLSGDLVVGKQYIVSYDALVNSGEAFFTLSGGGLTAIDIPLSNSMKSYQIVFTALSNDSHYLRCAKLSSGQSAYVDNIQIREVSSARDFLTISSASLSSDQTKVTLITSEHTPNTNYTVSASNIADLSDNIISIDSSSQNYVLVEEIDTTPPTLTNAYLSTPNELRLSFSEIIQETDALLTSNYSITNNNSSSVNLFKPNTGSFENGTESWNEYGSNIMESSSEASVLGSKSLKISYVNSSGGAYLYLSNTRDLSTDLEVGKEYSLTYWAKVTGGSAMVILSGGRLRPIAVTINDEFQKYEIKFVALSKNRHYVRLALLSSGETVFIDDLQIKSTEATSANIEITSAALNSQNNEVILSTSSHSSGASYTVNVKNIKDLAGNLISSEGSSAKYQLNISESQEPAIFNADLADNSTIIVSFSEALNFENNLELSDIFINNGISIQNAELTSDKTQMVIYTTQHKTAVDYSLEIQNLETTEGKKFNPDSSKKTYNIELVTGINDDISLNDIPNEYELYNNYPNPFNPTTIISFGLPEKSFVQINVYNILGEVVTNLINTELDAGKHQINFDASNLSSGIYIYSIKANKFSQTKKMILSK